MSVLEKIAFFQNKRGEVPNQELARELASSENRTGIAEIAANLQNKNQNIQSDCLKVLYEIGYLKPELIAGYAPNFLELLKSKNNRMVWGAMIALATVADKKPKEIYAKLDDFISAYKVGTLITQVWGTKALAKVAAADPAYQQKIFPLLTMQLERSLARDVPMHLESILPAINAENKAVFLGLVEKRKPEMTPAQLARLKKVIRKLG